MLTIAASRSSSVATLIVCSCSPSLVVNRSVTDSSPPRSIRSARSPSIARTSSSVTLPSATLERPAHVSDRDLGSLVALQAFEERYKLAGVVTHQDLLGWPADRVGVQVRTWCGG